jgi:hypothetical protein
MRMAAQRDDLLPIATIPLMRAYQALLSGDDLDLAGKQSPPLTNPIRYGAVLQRASADDHAAHAHMTLVLSRRLHSNRATVRASQVKNVIAMLWLRPSNPVPRDWDYLREMHPLGTWIDEMSDWITNAESVPHILEILRHLAEAQRIDPAVGPLWRTTVNDEVKDPHFIEALQTFDQLMGMDCTDDDHCMLVNLVCQDLELEPNPDFDHYFTPSRLDTLALLKDHCLRVLVTCARGPDFLSPVTVPEAYGEPRRESLKRVTKFVYKRFSAIDSPAALQLQASLWPMALETTVLEEGIYHNAMQDTKNFVGSYLVLTIK